MKIKKTDEKGEREQKDEQRRRNGQKGEERENIHKKKMNRGERNKETDI